MYIILYKDRGTNGGNSERLRVLMTENLENENTQGQETETEETVTMTKEELNALLQKEGDRRVSSALKKQEQKNTEKLREAQKLAKMSEDEKYQYELEQRERAIEEKERQLALSENRNAASKILADKGLSLELVDFVVAEDAESMNEAINKLDKAFKRSVKAEVEKRLGGSSPKKTEVEPSTLTKEQFAKLSLAELQRLKNEDPEVYNSLAQ